jgi:hypothetical protein
MAPALANPLNPETQDYRLETASTVKESWFPADVTPLVGKKKFPLPPLSKGARGI